MPTIKELEQDLWLQSMGQLIFSSGFDELDSFNAKFAQHQQTNLPPVTEQTWFICYLNSKNSSSFGAVANRVCEILRLNTPDQLECFLQTNLQAYLQNISEHGINPYGRLNPLFYEIKSLPAVAFNVPGLVSILIDANKDTMIRMISLNLINRENFALLIQHLLEVIALHENNSPVANIEDLCNNPFKKILVTLAAALLDAGHDMVKYPGVVPIDWQQGLYLHLAVALGHHKLVSLLLRSGVVTTETLLAEKNVQRIALDFEQRACLTALVNYGLGRMEDDDTKKTFVKDIRALAWTLDRLNVLGQDFRATGQLALIKASVRNNRAANMFRNTTYMLGNLQSNLPEDELAIVVEMLKDVRKKLLTNAAAMDNDALALILSACRQVRDRFASNPELISLILGDVAITRRGLRKFSDLLCHLQRGDNALSIAVKKLKVRNVVQLVDYLRETTSAMPYEKLSPVLESAIEIYAKPMGMQTKEEIAAVREIIYKLVINGVRPEFRGPNKNAYNRIFMEVIDTLAILHRDLPRQSLVPTDVFKKHISPFLGFGYDMKRSEAKLVDNMVASIDKIYAQRSARLTAQIDARSASPLSAFVPIVAMQTPLTPLVASRAKRRLAYASSLDTLMTPESQIKRNRIR